MEDLDHILDDFTNPASGSLHGAVFIAVDESGISIPLSTIWSSSSNRWKETRYSKRPPAEQALTLMAQSPYR